MYVEPFSMLLALPLLVGLILGLLLGGSFKNLSLVPIRFGGLFVLGLVLQLALFTSLTDTQPWDITYGHLFYVVSVLLVLSALVLNIRRLQWPVVIMAFGAALNLLVIVANGGAMPVDTHLLGQAYGQQLVSNLVHHRFAINVTPLSGSTALPFLGDRIRIAGSVYSIGDITLGLGVGILALFEMNRGGWRIGSFLNRFRPSAKSIGGKDQSVIQAA